MKGSPTKNPINTGLVSVPQQWAYIVERFGRYRKTLNPGLNVLIPCVDTIAYTQCLKELVVDVAPQSCITKDNVTISLDGVLYYKIFDSYKASYGVHNAQYAMTQLAQTTMRSEIGKLHLDSVFKERDSLNAVIVENLNKAANDWGVTCLRYEIQEIKLPDSVQHAMQMQVEAERKKRALILESEGVRESSINKAEAQKQSTILASQAQQTEQVNRATGEAEAMIKLAVAKAETMSNLAQGEAEALKKMAEAKAESVKTLAKALNEAKGEDAANLQVAQQYVEAFGNLAKTSNTLIVPGDASNVSQMVTQALSIYNTVAHKVTAKGMPKVSV